MGENIPNEIPKFDLAEQIMSEYRKNSSIRRKGPSQKNETSKQQNGSFSYTTKPPSMLTEQETIIAEIVARDIEKFCSGDTRPYRQNQWQ